MRDFHHHRLRYWTFSALDLTVKQQQLEIAVNSYTADKDPDSLIKSSSACPLSFANHAIEHGSFVG
jgi:hypothetical protein